ncbi:class I SAM-dependent methyltransferase [Flexibacterium corallicola]|uniref:class I SAM-dependent methyltransferase n=1 Tax=Flexibacterium corallicola TaxID=3037259 RepID=UPI00286EC73A|nr:methyltransferase domain-containing protein [Pseudovibrio sp. M1P-2-3]
MGNATSAGEWDEEYQRGRWDFLRSLPESGRYGIIAMWLQLTGTGRTVLDVGCGEGLLYKRLAPLNLQSYVGIDLAPHALTLADVRREQAELRAADMHDFTPEKGERFSAIVFNEVLHFASSPSKVVSRYIPFLEPGGVIAVSMYAPSRESSGANKLIRELWRATDDGALWQVLDDYTLHSHVKNVSWRMRLMKPAKP